MKKKLSTAWADVLDDLKSDPEFKAEWERQTPFRELSAEIHRVRVEAGLTQAELAERLNTSRSTIARMESLDYGKVSFATLVKLAEALNLEVEVKFHRKAS